jgi:hypothetical protein
MHMRMQGAPVSFSTAFINILELVAIDIMGCSLDRDEFIEFITTITPVPGIRTGASTPDHDADATSSSRSCAHA